MCLRTATTVFAPYCKTNNGEIRFIYDANGNIVTTYLYDAWGNPIPTYESSDSEVGRINPFRYKSYYYDSETRLYYLQSRYYDPQVGRFLNADDVKYLNETDSILNTNLNIYCINNSINMIDIEGTIPQYIDSQRDPQYADIKYGFFGGNIGENGCGVVAVYNLLLSYSKRITFGKVNSDLTSITRGITSFVYNGIGKIGVSPYSIVRY